MFKKLLALRRPSEVAERIIFYIFIIAIPFQTRVILKMWGGSFNEWNSAFLYGTDILVLSLLLFWLGRIFFDGPAGRPLLPWCDKFLLVFLALAALSISQAGNKFSSFYNWLKLLEMIGLYFYVKNNAGNIFNISRLIQIVILSGFVQSILAILQVFYQRSLDLKILGESVLRPNFSGVAVVPVAGEKFLRAYGTLPHPNVLVLWIFLAIFAFYFWYLYRVDGSWRGAVFLVYPVLLWGLFSTFSRVAIGLWGVGVTIRLLIIWLKRKKYNLDQNFKNRWQLLLAVTVAVIFIFGFFYWPQVQSRLWISIQDQAVSQRIFYIKTAGEIILDKPWLGVGLGQFVSEIMVLVKNYPSYFYQPVHNIYFLIANETGLLGFAAFLIWLTVLIYTFSRNTGFKELSQVSFLIIFLSILVMGLFDHFLWTLQQGQLIFWLTMGLAAPFGRLQKVI